MIRSLTTAATGMVAQQYNLDTISNNLANINTTGFKSVRAEFEDLMYQTYKASGASNTDVATQPVPVQIGLGAKFSATATNFTAGALQSTGNPTDVAINGEGFFQVIGPDGKQAYTRDGSFKQDVDGKLVTSDGYPLADDVTIPLGATAVSISSTGIVSAVLPGQQDAQPIGKIQVALFSNPAGLTRMGNNLFKDNTASGQASLKTAGEDGAGTLQATFLEGSNVSTIDEMVAMITAQRAYEINSKAIQSADDMMSTLNNLKR